MEAPQQPRFFRCIRPHTPRRPGTRHCPTPNDTAAPPVSALRRLLKGRRCSGLQKGAPTAFPNSNGKVEFDSGLYLKHLMEVDPRWRCGTASFSSYVSRDQRPQQQQVHSEGSNDLMYFDEGAPHIVRAKPTHRVPGSHFSNSRRWEDTAIALSHGRSRGAEGGESPRDSNRPLPTLADALQQLETKKKMENTFSMERSIHRSVNLLDSAPDEFTSAGVDRRRAWMRAPRIFFQPFVLPAYSLDTYYASTAHVPSCNFGHFVSLRSAKAGAVPRPRSAVPRPPSADASEAADLTRRVKGAVDFDKVVGKDSPVCGYGAPRGESTREVAYSTTVCFSQIDRHCPTFVIRPRSATPASQKHAGLPLNPKYDLVKPSMQGPSFGIPFRKRQAAIAADHAHPAKTGAPQPVPKPPRPASAPHTRACPHDDDLVHPKLVRNIHF